VTRRTIVALHAHPDDESLLTAGTLARAAAAGDRVVLVLATRGERGDVGAELLDDADLGSRRSREAQASADALGVARLVFLDLLDSGLEPAADGSWPPGSLCATDPDDVARRVEAVLVEEGADLLIADDRNGGYGHPDHRRVHEVAVLAATRAGIPLLEATIDREFLTGGIALAESMGLSVPEGFVPPDVSTWYTPAAEITHAIAVGDALAAKRASMEAHASQATGAADTVRTLAVFLDLPPDVFALAFGTEWFVQRGAPTEPRADDLFGALPRSGP
jgi:LmbE family N-acetylglucosaminyl deacetylase